MNEQRVIRNYCIYFFIFYIKLQQCKGWKSGKIILTKFFFEVCGEKRSQSGPKTRLFKSYGKLKHVLNFWDKGIT